MGLPALNLEALEYDYSVRHRARIDIPRSELSFYFYPRQGWTFRSV